MFGGNISALSKNQIMEYYFPTLKELFGGDPHMLFKESDKSTVT